MSIRTFFNSLDDKSLVITGIVGLIGSVIGSILTYSIHVYDNSNSSEYLKLKRSDAEISADACDTSRKYLMFLKNYTIIEDNPTIVPKIFHGKVSEKNEKEIIKSISPEFIESYKEITESNNQIIEDADFFSKNRNKNNLQYKAMEITFYTEIFNNYEMSINMADLINNKKDYCMLPRMVDLYKKVIKEQYSLMKLININH